MAAILSQGKWVNAVSYLRRSSRPDESLPFAISVTGVSNRQHFLCSIPLEQMNKSVILKHLDNPIPFPIADFIDSNLNGIYMWIYNRR